MLKQATNQQERLDPESCSDLDHGALPAIQPSNQARDPQTGDVSAVLQRRAQTTGLHSFPSLANIWSELFTWASERVAHQDFTAVAVSGVYGTFVAARGSAGVPQEAQ